MEGEQIEGPGWKKLITADGSAEATDVRLFKTCYSAFRALVDQSDDCEDVFVVCDVQLNDIDCGANIFFDQRLHTVTGLDITACYNLYR